jgi:S1-C subfamily serine protease
MRTWSGGGWRLICLCMAVSLCLSALAAGADEAGAKGREIVTKWGQSVIKVRVVAKIRVAMEGREVSEEEDTDEATATIIDPSGLAVCSLSEADPAHVADLMAQERDFKWEAEITDLKMRLADGRELPAKIVLRDKDLDLAFVRPTEALAEPVPAVDLSSSAQPEVLDEVVVLARLGEVVNRATAASYDRIQAIVDKPRKLYVPGIATMAGGLGRPVFVPDGKVVGILILRSMSAAASAAASGSGMNSTMLPVILPAADVLEVAKQAPK